MVTKCNGCGAVIFNILFMECSKVTCKKLYDLKCIGFTQQKFEFLSQEEKDKWICPECVCSNPKAGNSDTPVRSSLMSFNKTFTPSTNINTVRGSKTTQINLDMTSDTECNDNLLLTEFREFRSEMICLFEKQAKDYNELQKILYRNESELYAIRESLKVVQEKAKKVDVLEQQLEVLITKNEHLENCLKSMSLKHDNLCEKETHSQNSLTQKPTFAKIVQQNVNVGSVDKTARTEVADCGAIKNAAIHRTDTMSSTSKEVIRVSENIENLNEDLGKWKTVERKKGKFTAKEIKKGGSTSILDIQATERKKHLHVWRLKKETSVECLEAYVKNVCGPEIPVKVEKIRQKTERDYASFIIGVPESIFESLCQPNIWPINAEFSEWVWFRKSTGKPKTQTQND